LCANRRRISSSASWSWRRAFRAGSSSKPIRNHLP
jgi:hypothetical protein